MPECRQTCRNYELASPLGVRSTIQSAARSFIYFGPSARGTRKQFGQSNELLKKKGPVHCRTRTGRSCHTRRNEALHGSADPSCPLGAVYAAAEAREQLGVYLLAGGTNKPYRCKVAMTVRVTSPRETVAVLYRTTPPLPAGQPPAERNRGDNGKREQGADYPDAPRVRN